MIKDWGRFAGAIIYFIAGLSIIILSFYVRVDLIYNEPREDFSNYPRFLWALAFSFFGFSLIAYRGSKEKHPSSPAWKSYPSIYLISLIIISALVFAVLHVLKGTSNYLFYFFASPICFVLSYYIDHVLSKSPFDFLPKN